jgi:hypothetical protein
MSSACSVSTQNTIAFAVGSFRKVCDR